MDDVYRFFWNQLADEWLAKGRQRLWRAHHDAVVRDWLTGWLRQIGPSRMLKTDLFEEAIGDGLARSVEAGGRGFIGIDIAAAVARGAARHAAARVVLADVRRLPFRDDAFDCVVSTSTLDHFETVRELRGSVEEILRVLRPSGQILLTLDNLSNPVVRLRNSLACEALRRVGVVPYRLGVSCTARGLLRLLGEVGAGVLEMTAILHCPRIAAVWLSGVVDRLPATAVAPRAALIRFLRCWETLGRCPTRLVTGYYLAVRAVKR
jgi:SAM-dependent methyltransferase